MSAHGAQAQQEWMEELWLSTGWNQLDPSCAGAFPMGAFVFAQPYWPEKGSYQGADCVWTVSTMAVAPMAVCARALLEHQGSLEWIFGGGGEESESVDFAALRGAKAAWELDSDSMDLGAPSGLHSHLAWASLTRNAANYMQARLGTLVDLDPWRGSLSAMALGRAVAAPCSEEEFARQFGKAKSALAQALGPCALFHRAGGGGSGPAGWRPAEERWPSEQQLRFQWGAQLAREEAESLGEAAREAPSWRKRGL